MTLRSKVRNLPRERAELWDSFQAQEVEETGEMLAVVDEGMRLIEEQGAEFRNASTSFSAVAVPGLKQLSRGSPVMAAKNQT